MKLSVIKQVELMAAGYPDAISLAQGIPSFDTPGCIKRRVERALKGGVAAKYSLSPGLPELREMIELSLARENMFYDWQSEILVTAGSIEAITASLLTITEPGDEVLIPEPTYTSYREAITLCGCTPVFVPLNEEKGWSFEIDKYKQAITDKTKAIFYCNPNNPTGTIYSKNQLLELAELAKEHDLYLISDEVYKDFVYTDPVILNDSEESHENQLSEAGRSFAAAQDDKTGIFSLAEVPELRERLIRIFSFSKAYAMTGWRVAYLHSDESIVQEILKVHDVLVTCAPVISQYAAMGALEMGESDVLKFKNEFIKRRELVCGYLDELNDHFTYVKPNSSYFVFPKLTDNTPHPNGHPSHFDGLSAGKEGNEASGSWGFTLDLLKKTQVAVVPGVAFGPNGEGHVRINFGRTEEDINTAFKRIGEYLK